MDNTYMVTVKAEAGGEMGMQPVTVTVNNVDETTEPEPDTLMERYDTNKDGEIQKSEVITAINDYLFGEGGIISKADVNQAHQSISLRLKPGKPRAVT